MELTPQQWENVKALFESALDKPPADRNAFLAEAAPDPAVRREVERLLAHHVESGGFLSQPVLSASASSSAQAQVQSFTPGELVAERFRIIRFLARGGMGEVYEAEDIELHGHVALKSIRSELIHDAKMLERFKREVYLARKVTHPNVCRIFDFFRQAPSSAGPGRGSVAFVAMELLEGETLATFLRRQPRVPVEQARPIAVQMAAGLGAAHTAGVLHRDFKPGNVVLVPRTKGVRAVITDFGLALRSSQGVSDAVPVTGTGEFLGTPAYMSPEQVEGKDLTPASDVYSLGLVLYQMITGTRAFDDVTPLAMAVRRIKEDPPPPRNLVPDLDRRWESVILRCLKRNPADRFQSGDEVADALRSEIKHHELWNIRPRVLVTALAAFLAIAAAILFLPKLYHPAPISNTPGPTIPVRQSVAVLPFHNLSGRADTEWLSTALPEMLTAELAAGGKLRTFPGENIARASADLGLTGQQTLARDSLAHLRKYLGSDYVVLGAYLDQGSASSAQLRIDLWLQDTKTGDIAATFSEKTSESTLDDVATRAAADLRRKLGAGDISAGEAESVRASLPSNTDAARLYSEGVAKLRIVDAQAARDLLERAVAADPGFALGHSALSDAWKAMGYDEKARSESKKALDLAGSLSHEDQLWIEGKDWELNRQWDKAVGIYRNLFEFFPDNIEYGLHLAAAQTQARTVDEALATLGALRRLPPPDRDDPRIEMQQAEVFDIKGSYKDELASASTAVARARDLGAKLLLAHALNQQARAFEQQGDLDHALRSAQEATKIAGTSPSARVEVARALTIVGIVRYDQGSFSDAADAYNHALAVQREIGNERGAATILNNLANVLAAQGDLAGSTRLLNQAIAMFREVGDKHSVAAVLNNIATRNYRQGNLEQARNMLEEALAASREIGDQERSSLALCNLGEVLLLQGDLKGAREMFEQSEDLSNQIGDESGVAYALFGQADVLTAQGDLDTAHDKYDESITVRTQIGEKGNVAETQMAQALLLFEQGRAAEAENALHQAREEFHKAGLVDDEILADSLLARVLLSQGNLPDAQKESSAAHDLLPKSQDLSVRLRASIAEAQVAAAAGKPDDATRLLEDAIASAKKSGLLGYQLEAQLALGEIEAKSGKVAAATSLLAEVRKHAQQKDFNLIANKAAEASKSTTQKK